MPGDTQLSTGAEREGGMHKSRWQTSIRGSRLNNPRISPSTRRRSGGERERERQTGKSRKYETSGGRRLYLRPFRQTTKRKKGNSREAVAGEKFRRNGHKRTPLAPVVSSLVGGRGCRLSFRQIVEATPRRFNA